MFSGWREVCGSQARVEGAYTVYQPCVSQYIISSTIGGMVGGKAKTSMTALCCVVAVMNTHFQLLI